MSVCPTSQPSSPAAPAITTATRTACGIQDTPAAPFLDLVRGAILDAHLSASLPCPPAGLLDFSTPSPDRPQAPRSRPSRLPPARGPRDRAACPPIAAPSRPRQSSARRGCPPAGAGPRTTSLAPKPRPKQSGKATETAYMANVYGNREACCAG